MQKTLAAMKAQGIPSDEADSEIARAFLGCMWEVHKGMNDRLSDVLAALRAGRSCAELFPDKLYE